MPKAGARCTCNWGWVIVAWILLAIGLWVLVAAFATQFRSVAPAALDGMVLGWYFIGLLIFGLGKMAKWKSHGACPVHGSMR